MTVKNLSVVLSFNARKAIPHNTGLINSVATAAQQHAVQFVNNWTKKIPRSLAEF